MIKKAWDISQGDKVDIGNGLKYEVKEVFENTNGKIKFLLYPYQNRMSASKKITLKEDAEVEVI